MTIEAHIQWIFVNILITKCSKYAASARPVDMAQDTAVALRKRFLSHSYNPMMVQNLTVQVTLGSQLCCWKFKSSLTWHFVEEWYHMFCRITVWGTAWLAEELVAFHPALCVFGTRVPVPQVKWVSHEASHLYLVTRLRMCGAMLHSTIASHFAIGHV